MNNKLLIIFLLAISLSCSLFSQDYNIKVKINGLHLSDTVYLGHYFGQYQFIDDTAILNQNLEGVFSKNKVLKGGMYLIVTPKKKFFDIIINSEKNFTIETDTLNFIKNMKIKGSKENIRFYEYLNFGATQSNEITVLRNKANKIKDKDSLAIIKGEIDYLNTSIQNYKLEFIKKNPKALISKVFQSSCDPEIPDAPILSNGRKDSTFSYWYYKNHFWDYYDFSDERLLNTPLLYNKMKQYFESLIFQIPDSISKHADIVCEKASVNKDVFKYVVSYLTYNYETSKVMGFDAVFVHMVNTYYKTGKAWWLSETTLGNYIKRSGKIEPNLLGKVAPNMIMQDTNLILKSLHDVKAKYTVVLFWEYDCGHCKTEIPKIKQFYDQEKDSLHFEIFAVCNDSSMVEMKKFIRKNKMNWINVNGPRTLTTNYRDLYDIYSTPVIYLLNEKKVIIAKRISYDQIKDIIKNDIKANAKK